MCNNIDDVLSEEVENEIVEQARHTEESPQSQCTAEDRVHCAITYGEKAVENKILISISENINTMAEAIKDSEKQKHDERQKTLLFFKRILICLLVVAGILIGASTFCRIEVRMESLVSVILAVLADVFAIVHTLVKYMTNVENYNAYGNLIDSLLKHIGNHKED
jgi:cytochrome b subunit of formate dehydrogenase